MSLLSNEQITIIEEKMYKGGRTWMTKFTMTGIQSQC
jgi:hypothetical protein